MRNLSSILSTFAVFQETSVVNNLKFLVIVTLLFTTCKKEQNNSPVAGQWEWFKATGGIGNIYQTPQNSGRSWQLTLNPDYTSSQTGDLMPGGAGTYTLTEDINPGWHKQLLNITSNGLVTTFSYSFISHDTLRLDHHIEVDGLSYFLVRK